MSERERRRKTNNSVEIPRVCVCVCWRGELSPTECLLESPPETNLPIPPTASPRPYPNLPRPNHTLGFLLDDMTIALRQWQLTTSLLEHGIRFRTAMKTKTAWFRARVPVLTQRLSCVHKPLEHNSLRCVCAQVCMCEWLFAQRPVCPARGLITEQVRGSCSAR